MIPRRYLPPSHAGLLRHPMPLVAALSLAVGLVAALSQGTAAQSQGRPLKPVPTSHVVPHLKPGQAETLTPGVGGTWTQLANLPPVAVDNCLLMTDGAVLCHQHAGRDWYRLTPSNTGSYQAGTWTLDSTMQAGYAPLYFASAVLADGRVIVEGGEYNCLSTCTSNWQTQGSFYDPATRIWTPVAPPAGWTSIGDAQSVILKDGTFMLADALSAKAAYLNPATLTWTAVSGHQLDNKHDEENWTLLPDGRVLTVDAWPSGSRLSELYDPVTQQWTSAGNTPVSLTDNNSSGASYEQGPGILRPDGTVFYIGANPSGAGHTAIYDTRVGVNGTWTAGPDLLGSDDAADAPAALLPNGNVLAQASPGIFGTPSRWYEVDGATNAVGLVPTPSYSFSPSSYYGQMLVLPTGQILQTEFSNDVRLYTPSGTYDPAWAPSIATVPSTVAPGSSNIISGTQFNGLSQGAAYGDDWQSATNYPLVRITNTATGHVFYAKTHHHSSMGVATAGLGVSTTFDVPAGIETGASTIQVVANGIPSAAVAITVQSGGTPPGAFSKTAPANSATGIGSSVTLSWSASSNAASYEYCLDTTNDNACATWTSTGTATSVTVNGLSAAATYYWQARAINAAATVEANSGTWWSLTTALSAPGAFSKTSPANGATGLAKNVTLAWSASAGATSYEYCFATSAAACTTWTSVNTSLSVRKNNLSSRTKYYWRVRARNSINTTEANAPGSTWSFTVR